MEQLDFDRQTAQYLEMIEDCLGRCLPKEKCKQQVVLDGMRYSLQAGGKRIRPMLVLEFCRICGGAPEQALPFAAAIEAVHSYSLIHDDLPCMDDDDFRRGKPSCHKAFGEANALLAGDGLLTLAFSLLSRAELPSERVLSAVRVLSEQAGVMGMIGGQVIDLESEGKPTDAETVRLTYELKTGALLKAACLLGCIAGGAGETECSAAAEYATALGFAFQIVDDILDIEGDKDALGKPIGSDQQNSKSTYVSLYGLPSAKQDAKAYTERALKALQIFEEREFLETLTKKLVIRDR